MLVLAGAGTGKTRVITYRVAHLLERGVPGKRDSRRHVHQQSRQCDEGTHQRTAALQRPDASGRVGLHVSFLLRAAAAARSARILGLPRDFAIYDDDDQTAAVKRALLQLDLPTDDFPPRSVRSQISHAKNHGITPGRNARRRRPGARRACASKLPKSSASTNKSCAKPPRSISTTCCCAPSSCCANIADVRAAWSARFQYLMVDEFQDTNASQEELVRLLAGTRKNVCVVGDEDQSIYGWRGARAGNLKRFTEDFPGAKIIRLEENYRSTQTILDAAAAVVENNSDRLGKTLQGNIGAGEPLALFRSAGFRRRKPNSSAARFPPLLRNEPDAQWPFSIARARSRARSKKFCAAWAFAIAWSAASAFTSAPKCATRSPTCGCCFIPKTMSRCCAC